MGQDMTSSRADASRGKLPFNIDVVMEEIRKAVTPLPKAALFELAEDGFTSPFEQLIACIISIRTLDETTLAISRRLFQIAKKPEEMLRLSVDEIDKLISPCTYHESKAPQILEIARQVVEKYQGSLPCEHDVMMSFSGVGIKCTNLVMGIACGQARIAVDIHVHRVANRWGYVRTSTPEKTTEALEQTLPQKYWIEINKLLVPFGKHICTGNLPKCSTCPVLDMCRQVGVARHR
jgi:endonuclease-3